MSPISVIITIAAYFVILFTISYIAGRKADNEGFFVGNRKSAWYVVAFAMIGSSICLLYTSFKTQQTLCLCHKFYDG